MTESSLPEISLEFADGSLKIRTSEAVYRITLAGRGPAAAEAAPQLLPPAAPPAPALAEAVTEKAAAPKPLLSPVPPASLPAAEEEDDEEYYRDLSHDMFREVGHLARRLSMSIRDVKIDKIESIDLQSAGDQLELAKDQLEDVVKMTESATNKIFDLGEGIQRSIDKVRSIMARMSQTAGSGDSPEVAGPAGLEPELEKAVEALTEYLAAQADNPLSPLLAQAESIAAALGAAGEKPAEPAPQAAPALTYRFPVEMVFQTVYELCTNETVKKHIKAMWETGEKGFDQKALENALNTLVKEGPDQDNFLNLDLKGVLRGLFEATGMDRFKQVLKKMASTSEQIFLDQTLPLEAIPGEAAETAPPAEPAPAAPAALDPEVMASFHDLLAKLRQESERLSPPELPADLGQRLKKALAGAPAAGPRNDQTELFAELDENMENIFKSVNSIIEALSFQDLSGQTIYRIVRLITDCQIQLLAMVVSFGSKLKSKAQAKEMTSDQSEKLAQVEVDKVMESLGVREKGQEEEPSKLNQDAVNNLLDSLGF